MEEDRCSDTISGGGETGLDDFVVVFIQTLCCRFDVAVGKLRNCAFFRLLGGPVGYLIGAFLLDFAPLPTLPQSSLGRERAAIRVSPTLCTPGSAAFSTRDYCSLRRSL